MSKRRKQRRNQKRKQKKLITLILTTGLCFIAGTLYCFACSALDDPTVWGDVTVNGVPIGGLTREEASLAVHAQYGDEYQKAALKVELAGKEYQVDVFPALGFKASEAVSKAYDPGHRLWILRGFDWLATELKGDQVYNVYPYVKDTDAIDAAIEKSGILEYNSTVEPKWAVRDDSLVIRKGKEGAAIDSEQLKQNILTALNEHNYSDVITCPATLTPPKEANIQKIYERIRADASNATLDPEKDYEIVPSVKGINFDVAKAQAIYDSTAYGEKAIIPLDVTMPEITTEDMNEKLFRDVLASYNTYGGGTSARVSNIYRAVESCNGTILLPGETFSYNQALGERTIERGYEAAAAYSSDSVIQEVGGGICQVSSTIFAATLYTELGITERQNHSMPVSYVPMGMDATVSWGTIDFKFTNTYKYPVKLNVYFDGYTVTAEIIGTKENDNIIDVNLESTGEYSANTYRICYDSNWNVLSNDQISYSYYTVPEKEKPVEPTPTPEIPDNNGNENTDGTDDSNGSDWETGDGSDSSDGSDWETGDGTDDSDGSDWETGDGSDGSDGSDWETGDGSDGSDGSDWETGDGTDDSDGSDWEIGEDSDYTEEL